MIEILNKYYEDGLVLKQTHPTLPLIIWNYSPRVQYEQLWDDITIQTRGLVTDINGVVVARPFKKFFNIEENRHVPTKDFEVFEKMDGSLAIIFNYSDEWILATRGSFLSEQAIKGREILEKYNYKSLSTETTYLCEILYKSNRIVVSYNDTEELVLLAAIETKTGYEYDIHNIDYSNVGFPIVKKYDGIEDYTKLKKIIDDNAEGFVIKFSNGERIKIKGETYVRLHKIMTNVSTTSIWDILSNGGNVDVILSDVPDEFYRKIKECEEELMFLYNTLNNDYGNYFRIIMNQLEKMGLPGDRKTFAALAKTYQYPSLLFGHLDGKDVSKGIWRIIKPEFEKL